MDWHHLLTPIRLYSNRNMQQQADIGRSAFQKDYDRVIFSNAFRRLHNKTQVHPLHPNDHVHGRLTHSLEVASIGRTLGIRLGEYLKPQLPDQLNPESIGMLVQTACLAHDIGHPPFGHAGERVIANWFIQHQTDPRMTAMNNQEQLIDLCCFDGNAQGFRVLTKIEQHYQKGGLRLTAPTLASIIKYPWLSSMLHDDIERALPKHSLPTITPPTKPIKLNIFLSEKAILEQVMELLEVPKISPCRWMRHPLSYLVEAADDICYALVDLEDALRLALIDSELLDSVLEPLGLPPIKNIEGHNDLAKAATLRGRAMGICIDQVINFFTGNINKILTNEENTPILDDCNQGVSTCINVAKHVAQKHIFDRAKQRLLHIGSEKIIHCLLDNFSQAVFNHFQSNQGHPTKPLNTHDSKLISMMRSNLPKHSTSLYEHYRCMLDYITGMTDGYAIRIAQAIEPDQQFSKVGQSPF